jgi:hypothetical protein
MYNANLYEYIYTNIYKDIFKYELEAYNMLHFNEN